MKTLAASLLIACAAASWTAAGWAATSANGALASASGAASDGPDRPGSKTHFSRGGFKLDNSGHPVTGQGPNKGTQTLNDTLEDAGVPSH